MSIFHPPLMNTLTALPLSFLTDLKVPDTQFVEGFGYEFLYRNNYKPGSLVFLARIPTLILSILTAILIFKLAKRLYGVKAGLFALFLFVFNPNIIAHSRLTTNDMGVTFFSLLVIYSFLEYNKKQSMKSLLILSVALGLALITKFSSAFLILPILILFVLDFFVYKKEKRKRLSSLVYPLLIMGLTTFLIINLAYGFDGSFSSFSDNVRDDNLINITYYNNILSSMEEENPLLSKIVNFGFSKVPLPLPYSYIKGFGAHITSKKPCYLLGEVNYKNKWYYYPLVFLIKSPISLLAFVGIALFFFLKNRKMGAEERILLIFLASLLLIFLIKPFCTGIRYFILPMCLIFILTSKITKVKVKKQRMFNYILLALSLFYVVSSVIAHPNYLSFYNELIGPEIGCRISVDGDCDYGQGIEDIKEYVDRNNIAKIKLSYHGTADPDYYNIDYELLPSSGYIPQIKGFNSSMCRPTEGVIAIYAMNLHRFAPQLDCFDWLKEHKPTDIINDNIFLYNISE